MPSVARGIMELALPRRGSRVVRLCLRLAFRRLACRRCGPAFRIPALRSGVSHSGAAVRAGRGSGDDTQFGRGPFRARSVRLLAVRIRVVGRGLRGCCRVARRTATGAPSDGCDGSPDRRRTDRLDAGVVSVAGCVTSPCRKARSPCSPAVAQPRDTRFQQQALVSRLRAGEAGAVSAGVAGRGAGAGSHQRTVEEGSVRRSGRSVPPGPHEIRCAQIPAHHW